LSAPALLAPDYREAGGGASDPYRLLAIRDGRPTEKRVVQLLPPESILPIDLSQRVTELAGKLPAEDTVAPFEVLERKGPRLIVEEAVSGFSLRELLAARGHSITSAEAIGILRELSAGLDAAIAAGLSLPALTTDSVVYEFPGETAEAIEALKTRPISEWPDSRPRLRIHPSMAGLLFPPPGGKLESGRNRRRAVTPGVLMERRFVGLANTLVVGPWPPTPDGAARPDAGEKREALRSYLRETLAAIDDRASTFDRGAFVGELEARLAGSPRREASESTASIAGAATALVGFLGAISPLAWEFFAFTGENRLFF
ncbi:MAG: hypothetical protein KDM91_13205, partial [Verrucomicrobiae bacterium]|nr:hypothetical protein [Verrucomicrobiae bacterium]